MNPLSEEIFIAIDQRIESRLTEIEKMPIPYSPSIEPRKIVVCQRCGITAPVFAILETRDYSYREELCEECFTQIMYSNSTKEENNGKEVRQKENSKGT